MIIEALTSQVMEEREKGEEVEYATLPSECSFLRRELQRSPPMSRYLLYLSPSRTHGAPPLAMPEKKSRNQKNSWHNNTRGYHSTLSNVLLRGKQITHRDGSSTTFQVRPRSPHPTVKNLLTYQSSTHTSNKQPSILEDLPGRKKPILVSGVDLTEYLTKPSSSLDCTPMERWRNEDYRVERVLLGFGDAESSPRGLPRYAATTAPQLAFSLANILSRSRRELKI
jgi:hypothetical protein